MNRGSDRRGERDPRDAPAFNEAPIHESGKYRRRHRDAPPDRPSMRPRFMNRGSDEPSWRRVRKAIPFNEAPIHESGK